MRWPNAHRRVASRASRLRVQVARHIDELDAQQWDSLVSPDDLQASFRFVKVCQDAAVEDAEYRHVLVWVDDRPACIASLSALRVRLDLLAGPVVRAVAEQGRRRVWPRFLTMRVLLGGLPVSFGQSCFRIAPWADREPILRTVAEIIDDAARETKAGLIAVKELSPVEAKAVDGLTDLGFFRVPSLPSCSLPIRWGCFEDYLASMRAPYRRQVVKTLRHGRQRGLRVRRVEDFSCCCDRIFRLYEAVMDRAEYQLERLNLAFFGGLDAAFGQRSSALLVERNGELLAAAIVLDGPTKSTFLIAGIDYASHRQTAAYLNLVTEVVRNAIQRGASCLEMGQTSYYLKTRLGAGTVPRFMYLKHRSPLWHQSLRAVAGVMFPVRTFPTHHVFRTS